MSDDEDVLPPTTTIPNFHEENDGEGPIIPRLDDGSKPMGPIVAKVNMREMGWIDADAELKEFALSNGFEVKVLPSHPAPFPPVVKVVPAAAVATTRRIHRKKQQEASGPPPPAAIKPPLSDAVVGGERSSSVITGSTTAVSHNHPHSKRLPAAPPLCQSCLRAMTLIERMKATVDGCLATCGAVMEELPPTSASKAQIEERYKSSVATANYAIADCSYVIRSLACNRGCIPVAGKPLRTHSEDPTE